SSDTLQTAAVNLASVVNGSKVLSDAKISASAPSGRAFALQFSAPPQAIQAGVGGAAATTTLKVVTPAPTGPLTAFRWPVPGGTPADLEPALLDTFSSEVSDAKTFPGGVPWAFESNNILRSVYHDVVSDGGWARSIHLSALGGWGTQRGL